MTWITLAAVALVLNVGMILWNAIRSWRRRKSLNDAIEELKNVSVTALGQASSERLAAQKERERADSYFRYVQQIEKERNEWQRLYHEAGMGMSRGQSMLLMEVVRLSNILKRHQIKVETDPKLAPAVESYVALHGKGAPPHEAAVKDKAHDPLAIVPAPSPDVAP